MGEETQLAEAGKGLRKRKIGHKKGSKGNKRAKMFQNPGPKKVKVTKKMQKLFRKRAREYNSDDEDEEGDEKVEKIAPLSREVAVRKKVVDENMEEDEAFDGANSGDEILVSDDDDEVDGIQPGVMRFSEGCRAFKIAFKKIMKRNISDDLLGPVLSGHKKLVVEKLAEEEAERKGKGEAKKEKLLLAEKGHVKPANFLDAHEKFLIGVATKGVVKLFNAVNKAQAAQKGLNPLRSKDAKDLKKRRKEAFFSELGKKRSNSDGSASKSNASKDQSDGVGPAWAPLRDNYMLTNSKLKDWDKMQDTSAGDEVERMTQDSSDDDD